MSSGEFGGVGYEAGVTPPEVTHNAYAIEFPYAFQALHRGGGEVICTPPLMFVYGESLMKYTRWRQNDCTTHGCSRLRRSSSAALPPGSAGIPVRCGKSRARSHCRFVLLLLHFTPESLT